MPVISLAMEAKTAIYIKNNTQNTCSITLLKTNYGNTHKYGSDKEARPNYPLGAFVLFSRSLKQIFNKKRDFYVKLRLDCSTTAYFILLATFKDGVRDFQIIEQSDNLDLKYHKKDYLSWAVDISPSEK